MSSFRYLLFFGTILLSLISLTKAVSLDIACTNNTNCGGTGAICQGGKCQCDTPWYTPCNTTVCNLKPAFVYQGKECRNDANCLINAVCNSQQCTCKANYTVINGLCYKSLNSLCTLPSDCWSGACLNGLCQCPSGFVSTGDNNRCKPKLAQLYANWTNANASGDFCYSPNSCLDSNAICQSVPPNVDKFCQCPSPYTADYVKQECQLTVCTGALSPSSTPIPVEQCGACSDQNALYIYVANQTTCWCQAGYINNNNQCQKNTGNFIFPDASDIALHSYASPNCSINANNGSITANQLCTCAPGYEFVDKTSPCRPITPTWINDNFEYGVCTRIKSNGQSGTEPGLCPSPLTCQQRQDKFVCSCGLDQYLDESSNLCYYFLGRNLTSPNASLCPPGSTLINNLQCQCFPSDVYTTSSDQKRCGLQLISDQPSNPCPTPNTTYDANCVSLYGTNTRFCKTGECRCISNSSFYANGTCVTLVNGNPGSNGSCPTNAQITGGVCACVTGYRASPDNKNCERKVTLLNSISTIADVTTADCKALFFNGPVIANINNSACVCTTDAYSNGTTCILYLNVPLLDPATSGSCPLFANTDSGTCQCGSGYTNSSDTACVQLNIPVYAYNDTNGVNVTGINTAGCIKLFGNAAEATQNGGYCRCLNPNLAFKMGNKCYFLVETNQTLTTGASDCPPSSIAGEKICNCPPGYQAVQPGKQACERMPISPPNLQSIDINTPSLTACNSSYTDNDCVGLYGAGAVCRNNTCYCDQSRSYVRNNLCDLFSNYVFPASQDRSSMACNSQDDCGVGSDSNGIECNYIQGYENNYKVCKCKSGYFLNPADSTCVNNRCQNPCSANEVCQGYECVCQAGYYRDPYSSECLQIPSNLQLYATCNVTVWNAIGSSSDGSLNCDPLCGRGECVSGYRETGSQCVQRNFNDYCADDPSICSQLSSNSNCSFNDNKCLCLPGFYQTNGEIICARAVNGPCVNDVDCGDLGQCLNRKCQCQPGRRQEQVHDSIGREIIRCINGVDQIRYSPVLLLFFVLIRLIFA